MALEDLAIFDDSNFDAEVLGREGLTVVDFWSKTCVPCQQLKKILGQVNEELPENVVIGTVDGDENLDLLSRYGVRGFPTLMFFKDGEVVETRTGVDRRQVQRAPRAAGEPGAVEEDARSVHHPRVRPRVVGEHAAGLGFGVVLEAGGVEGRADGGDVHRLVDVEHLGAHRTTALFEVR